MARTNTPASAHGHRFDRFRCLDSCVLLMCCSLQLSTRVPPIRHADTASPRTLGHTPARGRCVSRRYPAWYVLSIGVRRLIRRSGRKCAEPGPASADCHPVGVRPWEPALPADGVGQISLS